MMSAIKDWIMTLFGTAMISAAVLMLVPESRIKKAVTICCGVAVVIAFLSIKTEFDYTGYSKMIAAYKKDMEAYEEKINETNKKLTRDIIEEQSEAYILDKGKEMGMEQIAVRVTAKWDVKQQCWYLTDISILTNAADDTAEKLSDWIEAEFGIANKNQKWSTYDEN